MVGPALLIPLYVQNSLALSALLSGLVIMPGAIINGNAGPTIDIIMIIELIVHNANVLFLKTLKFKSALLIQ
jgi:hypothetical protein